MTDRFTNVYDVDKERDLAKNRVVSLEDGSKLFVRQLESDAWGFWTIHIEKGKTPKELSGRFTSFDLAYKCVLNYCHNRFNKAPVQVEKGYVTTAGDGLTVLS